MNEQQISPIPPVESNQKPPFFRFPKGKLYVFILSVVLLAVIVYAASVVFLNLWPFQQKMTPVDCTAEAKVCPDGTAVGRVPPSCEFAPCPGDTPEWLAIKQAIYNCEVESTSQYHSLEVSAKLKNGVVLRAIEPSIDDIITVAEEAEEKCGKIMMATE